MTKYNIPRIIVAGIHSEVGKTTIVTGFIAALHKIGLRVQSYKVGPDYIDPDFHRLAGDGIQIISIPGCCRLKSCCRCL